MYARVTWLEGSPAQARELVAAMREQAIPAIEATPGFQEVLFLMDREGGRALALTFWETLEDLEDSEELARRLRSLPVADGPPQAPSASRSRCGSAPASADPASAIRPGTDRWGASEVVIDRRSRRRHQPRDAGGASRAERLRSEQNSRNPISPGE